METAQIRRENNVMSEPTPNPQSTETETPTPAEAPAAKTLEERLAEAEARTEQQRETALRALAEADNVRKRAAMEVANAHKFALERFVESLLPVVDSLEAALGTAQDTPEAVRSGIELTLKQLRGVLEKAGVTDIAPPAGAKFDPHWHQAMAAVESDAEPNSVVAVLQRGWRLHERVVRPALVTVAKPRPANDA
jgi:molecular chaperone GrpE